MLNIANQITIFRILLILPFIMCMTNNNNPQAGYYYRYSAVAIFIIMAISDGVDGFIARRWNMVSTLGSFLDPMADKLLMTCSCLLLACVPSAVAGYKLPLAVVTVIIGKDLILTMGFITFYMLTKNVKVVPNFLGKSCTILQLTMVGATLIAPEVTKYLGVWGDFVKILWVLSALAAFFSTLVYIRNGSRYIEEFKEA